MIINIHHPDPGHQSYRAACVRSLYNVTEADFKLTAEMPLDEEAWKIGAVVGPSGSGKSSIGRAIWGPKALTKGRTAWPADRPIIDGIAPKGDWQQVTAALAAVGLGSVPAWLRPYQALSTGERFRADLARLIADPPPKVVIDEFTSVVDRQVAQVGSHAFAKAWRRTGGQAVVLSCHYDILPWLEPDWVFDTAEGRFYWARGRLQRPQIKLDIFQAPQSFWRLFKAHHYLDLPPMIASTTYVGFVGETPVAHVAVSTRPGLVEARACRLVIMPEWQGAGVGLNFLEAVCGLWRHGRNRYNLPLRTLFHTSHPGLAAALRRRRGWTQVSACLYGGDKARSAASVARSAKAHGGWAPAAGYGGHFRAVQGFRYLGDSV